MIQREGNQGQTIRCFLVRLSVQDKPLGTKPIRGSSVACCLMPHAPQRQRVRKLFPLLLCRLVSRLGRFPREKGERWYLSARDSRPNTCRLAENFTF